MIRHAGLIARHAPSGWRGVLLEGPSGCGKSDLALRAIAQGFQLVADDRVALWMSSGELFGAPPETLSGLVEVRGLGVLPIASLRFAPVALVVRHGRPERSPEPAEAVLLEARVPLLTVDFRSPSAPAKLGRALDAFDLGGKKRI